MRVCYADMELAAAERRYEKLHEDEPWHNGLETSWAKEWSLEHPYHFRDGKTFWVADVDVDPKATWLKDTSDEDVALADPDWGDEWPPDGNE